MAAPRFHRVAAGDYETRDGRFMLHRLLDVNPPAWNIEETREDAYALIVDGAATKRDALALFADWFPRRQEELAAKRAGRLISCAWCGSRVHRSHECTSREAV